MQLTEVSEYSDNYFQILIHSYIVPINPTIQGSGQRVSPENDNPLEMTYWLDKTLSAESSSYKRELRDNSY